MAYKQQKFISLGWFKMKALAECLGESSLWVHRRLSSHCVLTWWKGQGNPVASFIKVLIPFMRAPPSWPNHLPKTPPLNTIALGVRFQYMNFRGTKNSIYSNISEGHYSAYYSPISHEKEFRFLYLTTPCSMWDLSSLIRDRTVPPAVEAWSPNHCQWNHCHSWNLFYLFIFGCIGPSLLHAGFL